MTDARRSEAVSRLSAWHPKRHRESVAFFLAGLLLIGHALYVAIRHQELLSEKTLDSAILFGIQLGELGAGLFLIAAAVLLAVLRVVWRWYDG